MDYYRNVKEYKKQKTNYTRDICKIQMKIELLNSKPTVINLTIWFESQNVNIFISNLKTQRNLETINLIIGRGRNKPQQSNFKTEETSNITEPKTISNTFNNFFVDVGSKLASKI